MPFLTRFSILKKFIGVGLILFIFALTLPQKTSAQLGVVEPGPGFTSALGAITSAAAGAGTAVVGAIGGATVATETADGIKISLNGLAWYAAKLIIKKMTAQTVNWINSGFKGNPAYVTDPDQFFLDVADDTASGILSSAQLNKLCTPFRAEVRLALVKNYISDDQNYSCTLSVLKNNYEQFTQDFSQGGWDGWFEMTQNSQNNPYGAYLNARNQLSINIGNEQLKYQKQLDWGSGFLSFEKCSKEGTVTQAMLDADPQDDGSALAGYKAGDCLGKKETVTPGSVVNDQLKKVLGSGVDALGAADSINEIFGALVDQLFVKMINGAKGLRGTKPEFPETKAPKSPGKLPRGVEAVDGTDYAIAPETPSMCPALTTPKSLCETVDRAVVLNILDDFAPSWEGIQEAIIEVKKVYPSAYVIPHDTGSRALDKIDFGGGLIVDVIEGALGPGQGPGVRWVWIQECNCGQDGGPTN